MLNIKASITQVSIFEIHTLSSFDPLHSVVINICLALLTQYDPPGSAQ